MKEESRLNGMDKQSGFRLPDDYFDRFTDRLMERLPQEQPMLLQGVEEAEPGLWQRVRPWLYMAAMFVGAALIIRIASPTAEEKAATLAREEAESQEIREIGTSLDGAMMDDYTLYVYLEDGEHY